MCNILFVFLLFVIFRMIDRSKAQPPLALGRRDAVGRSRANGVRASVARARRVDCFDLLELRLQRAFASIPPALTPLTPRDAARRA